MIPAGKTMGPCHRTTTQCSEVLRLQDIPHGKRRRRLAARVYKRTTGEGIHLSIKIPLRITILFHQEERWEAPTRTRLPMIKLSHSKESIPTTPNPRAHRPTPQHHLIYQTRHPLGLQQRLHQGRGSREGSLQNKPGTL